MAFTEREKAAEKALKRLYPFLIKSLNPDLRHELYARDMLAWQEQQEIASVANIKSDASANEAILSALSKRGPDALDVLIESLEVEEDVHKRVIERIRKEWPEKSDQESQNVPSSPTESVTEKEFLGNGEWPVGPAAPVSSESISIPSPPVEGVDNAPKMVYKMSARPRGIGIVINNKYFTCGMKDRVGTDRDADSLARLFTHLGFYTNRYDNLKGKEMKGKLQTMGSLDHTKYDCLIVAVLTHGVNGKLYSTDGDLISVETITEYFDGNNCPTLIGKPKVFILQACRGGKFDYGVESETTDGPSDAKSRDEDTDKMELTAALDGDETDGGGYQGALPTEADFVLAYATVPGYVSWRNSEYGSWFIKAFVDTMHELGKKEHFLDILTEVNRKVAEEFQSRGRNKQIPAPVTMLTRKLYLRPGSYS